MIDCLIDLARRSGHRLMVRLVKGAYWDSEIKRAQVDGLEGFPVFTRKVHTDVSYLACARKLLAAPDAVFPQFATHNALDAGHHLRHGRAELLRRPVRVPVPARHGRAALRGGRRARASSNRPCRIYAPVGTHETLLAYLVRRLLENGANTSFVNQIADPNVSARRADRRSGRRRRRDRAASARRTRSIALPRDLFGGERENSAGLDLTERAARWPRSPQRLLASAEARWQAVPLLADGAGRRRSPAAIRNPADRRDIVGTVIEAAAPTGRCRPGPWRQPPAPSGQPRRRPSAPPALLRAADLMEARMPALLGLIVREAGKSLSNAVGEVREAVDFLRYYGAQVARDFSNDTHRPLGPVACISPWNFPLSIFTGQVAAALAAGNAVIAKPAEETPLIAAQAVAILHEAGVPRAGAAISARRRRGRRGGWSAIPRSQAWCSPARPRWRG